MTSLCHINVGGKGLLCLTQNFFFFLLQNLAVFAINSSLLYFDLRFEPLHERSNNLGSVPNEDSDQPGQSPSLISVFTVS